MLMTAIWRAYVVSLVFCVVLNATRVPSGEIAGKMPSAIFFSPVPSRLAIQTAWSRSNAMCRSRQKTEAVRAATPKRGRNISFIAVRGGRKKGGQRGGGSFVSWQYECGEKSDGERG